MFQAPNTRAFAGMRLEIRRITSLDAIKLRTAVSRHINAHPWPTSPISWPPSRDISSKPKKPPILPLLCQALLLVWWLSWVCHACWVFQLHNPLLRLWALSLAWVITLFEVDRYDQGLLFVVLQIWFHQSKFLGAPEILHLNFGMGSKKHGFFTVCCHQPRPLLGQNFNMVKGVFARLLSLWISDQEDVETQDGELKCALPWPPSCEYDTTFDALRLTRWDAANGARAWQKPSYWRLNPCDFQDPDSSGSTRAWTEHALQPDSAQDSTISPSISGTGSLRETTRLQGQLTSPSLHSKVYAALVKTCARRNTAHLHPCCAQRTSLRASDSWDKAQHQLSPPRLRIPISCYTSYNTISPSYTPLPGVMTTLALQTSLILVVEFHAVCRCTICGAQADSEARIPGIGPRGHFHKSYN